MGSAETTAEKGQNAREQAAREYEERKARRDEQEQARLDKLAKKNSRNNVARNLYGIGDGGFFASLGGDDFADVPEGTPYKNVENKTSLRVEAQRVSGCGW